MSMLQWQLGHLNVSFDQEVPVPSYISFEKPRRVKELAEEDEEDEMFMLQGGANPKWDQSRFRVIASADLTENVSVNGRDVDFDINPMRNGAWGVANMPLPRQVVLTMLSDMPAVQQRLDENTWEEAVRSVSTKMRGFDTSLEFPFQGPGEQKWVVKRMRDIGPTTPQQLQQLEQSPGRIKTNMFWLAHRQWECIRAIMNLNLPEVEELLKPEIFLALTRANLPTKAKDVMPRQYAILYEEGWLRVAGAVGQVNVVSENFDVDHFGGNRSSSTEDESLKVGKDASPSRTFGAAPSGPPITAVAPSGPSGPSGAGSLYDDLNADEQAMVPFGQLGTGGQRTSPLLMNRQSSSDEQSMVPFGQFGIGGQRASALLTNRPSSSNEQAPDQQAVVPFERRGRSRNRPEVAASPVGPPLLEGGDHLSSETGMYSGVPRWTGQYQEIDNLPLAPGYDAYMNQLFQKHMGKLTALNNVNNPKFNYILQTLQSYSNNATMLHPLLFLLENDLFVGTLQELQARGIVDNAFNEQTLLQVCQESWLELKPNERFRIEPGSKFQIMDNSTIPEQELFALGYSNINMGPNSFITELRLTGSPESVKLVNYLPLVLYQISKSMGGSHDILRFNKLGMSPNYKTFIQTMFGSAGNVTKDNLRDHLMQLQDDLGFYKLTKQAGEYFANPSEKTTMIVFDINLKSKKVQFRDIETWITGYIITNINDLFYSIVKQGANIAKFPWLYTNRIATAFEGNHHLKIELICRRKLNPELQGIGFVLMTFFLGYMSMVFGNLSMVLVDVTRTHGDRGLPDPMFSQLFHERFKFQRAFEFEPLLTSPFFQALPDAETQPLLVALRQIFSVDEQAPYRKQYKNGITAAQAQQEFHDLPEDLNLNNMEADTQQVLQQGAKILTFVRPLPSPRELGSIFQRFIQNDKEKKDNVARGALAAY